MTLYSILCGETGRSTVNGAARANGNVSGNGNGRSYSQEAPYAWVAPEDLALTGESTFTWFASPYNSDDIGIVPLHKNEVESVIEVQKQLPPSFTYEGPVAGAGFLDLFAPKPGSPKYNAYVIKQETKGKYNPETIGIAPLAGNAKTTAIEIDRQTEGTSLWEKFTTGVEKGYTREPEDVNVFEESVTNAKNALTGAVSPSNYYLLAIAGGALLLLILIIK